jgi:hypothetical protein
MITLVITLNCVPSLVSVLFDTPDIQGDFEGCADILTCHRTSQKVTIKPGMSYTNVDIFRKNGAKSFPKKKVWKPLNFMKKWVKRNHSRLFFCHLIQNQVTLTRASILTSI